MGFKFFSDEILPKKTKSISEASWRLMKYNSVYNSFFLLKKEENKES